MAKILLNKQRSKKSVNLENKITLNINNKTNIIPLENINEKVDSYEQYLSEKKASQTYRLSFNITPICTNVLFNNVSEIIYHEGADDCIVFNSTGTTSNVEKIPSSITNYCDYKYLAPSSLTRSVLISDTAFSHKDIGGVVYHCGYDIFNNHTLRKKEFNIVNKLRKLTEAERNDSGLTKMYANFNTIKDCHRDCNGYIIKDRGRILNGVESINKIDTFDKHLYHINNILSYEESINENLVEKNGWVGFINPTSLNINNYVNDSVSLTLNKCMNNNKPCEMIDMYPDRSLFSFIPKINKYRNNREEKNWDYCLTYPYEKYYNDLVQHESKIITNDGEVDIKINGLTCQIIDDVIKINSRNLEYIDVEDGTILRLKTKIKNNFNINTILNFVLIGYKNGKKTVVNVPNNYKVMGIGDGGKDKEHIFKIYADELLEELDNFATPSKVEIRVRKIADGNICEYYFRKFKRIPNFKNTNVYNDELVTKEEIDLYSKDNFNSSLNGMGFSRTIYNDRNAQLIFNDDIVLKGLRDNLGREISEIFLTIVKSNKGNEKWYDEKDYISSELTFSRCFSEVSSGVDIKDNDVYDYNIHKIHNIKTDLIENKEIFGVRNGDSSDEEYKKLIENYNKVLEDYKRFFKPVDEGYELPEPLEKNITISGDTESSFLGDIIEFNVGKIQENVLEDVYHRFNTRQRESLDSDYRYIFYDKIVSDDYDIESKVFEVETDLYNKVYKEIILPINVAPEGYYYKPHHRIILKEYNDVVREGRHTLLSVSNYYESNGNKHNLVLSKNYFLEEKEKVYLFHRQTKKKIIGYVESVGGNQWTNVVINADIGNYHISGFTIYKHNIEKPDTSYELNDGSGRYLWRDFKEDYEYEFNSEISNYIFTNNAHYINKNVIFTLHRQDPTGFYELNNNKSILPIVTNLSVEGETNDYSNIETIINNLEDPEC